MPAPLSLDLRNRVVLAHLEEGLNKFELAARFFIGVASASRVIALYKRTGSVAPRVPVSKGRKPTIAGEVLETLLALVDERPDRTIAELHVLLEERAAVSTSTAAVSRALLAQGLTRKKRLSKPRNATPIE